MKPVKEYYRTYQADDSMIRINQALVELVMHYAPAHVLEFGCGTGKNLSMIKNITCRPHADVFGVDLSFLNCLKCFGKDLTNIIHGDEGILGHLGNFDVVYTCSVLDHIEDIDSIITEFKRMANKAIFLAETNSIEGDYYWKHDYESYGFTKLEQEYPSPDDGAIYHIWVWKRPETTNTEDHHE